MKNLLFILVLLGCTVSAKAQKKSSERVNLSLGIDAGLPTGGLKDTHSFMYGASVQVGVPVLNKLHFTASLGYNNFVGRSNVDLQLQDAPLYDYVDIKSVPIKIGVKYYLEPNFYLQGEGGGVLLPNSLHNHYEPAIASVYALQTGVELPAGAHSFINTGLRYEATNHYGSEYNSDNISFVALHLAFIF